MKAALLLRILACVALVVSGLPVWALVCRPVGAPAPTVATTIVRPTAVSEAACAMPCCAERPKVVEQGCCPTDASSEISAKVGSHVSAHAMTDAGCALDVQAQAPTDLIAAAAPIAVDDLAILPAPTFAPVVENAPLLPLARLRVGIAGLDAGPPPDASRRPEAGRAPPFARA